MPVVSGEILEGGPVVDLLIGVSGPRKEKLENVGLPVPQRVRVRAVIDTGSALTGIRPDALALLGIDPLDEITIATPSTWGTRALAFRYHVSLSLPGEQVEMHFEEALVLGAPFHQSEGIQALIGRDILEECLFVYDGVRRLFSLGF